MKLTKHIGCLLALVFATASAFAETWFTADLSAVTDTAAAPWSAKPAGWKQVVDETTYYEFNDWNAGLVYTADYAKKTSSSNSVIKTTVKFTAIDGVDVAIPTEEMTTALDENVKAGLTIVETATDETRFYGIVNGQWTLLTGDTEDALKGPVEVKVEITKGENANYVKYTVGTEVLKIQGSDLPLETTAGDCEIRSVSYKGCVQALGSLVAFAYGNTAAAKEEVVITDPGTDVPPTIKYNPVDLADRGIDVTSADAIKNYLTGTQDNDYLGWVNTTLGLDDTQKVAVATCEGAAGSVTVNFGFIPDGNSTIKYVVGDGDALENATINTGSTGISNVTVQVSQGGKTVTVDTVQVGVMNTGKKPTEAQKAATTPIFDIVAVPFEAFQGEVYVANLLNTAELNAGDKLYIHNGDGYDTFVLEAGAWKAEGATSYSREEAKKTLDPADQYKLTAGQAIWIERNPNSKIVFTGKGEIDVSHKWTWKPEYGEYSLVANPTIKDFVLNDATFGGIGDTIVVEDVANPQQFEKTAEGWGTWKVVSYKNKRGQTGTKLQFVRPGNDGFVAGDLTIKAGIGFWYYKADALTQEPAELTIDFGKNE